MHFVNDHIKSNNTCSMKPGDTIPSPVSSVPHVTNDMSKFSETDLICSDAASNYEDAQRLAESESARMAAEAQVRTLQADLSECKVRMEELEKEHHANIPALLVAAEFDNPNSETMIQIREELRSCLDNDELSRIGTDIEGSSELHVNDSCTGVTAVSELAPVDEKQFTVTSYPEYDRVQYSGSIPVKLTSSFTEHIDTSLLKTFMKNRTFIIRPKLNGSTVKENTKLVSDIGEGATSNTIRIDNYSDANILVKNGFVFSKMTPQDTKDNMLQVTISSDISNVLTVKDTKANISPCYDISFAIDISLDGVYYIEGTNVTFVVSRSEIDANSHSMLTNCDFDAFWLNAIKIGYIPNMKSQFKVVAYSKEHVGKVIYATLNGILQKIIVKETDTRSFCVAVLDNMSNISSPRFIEFDIDALLSKQREYLNYEDDGLNVRIYRHKPSIKYSTSEALDDANARIAEMIRDNNELHEKLKDLKDEIKYRKNHDKSRIYDAHVAKAESAASAGKFSNTAKIVIAGTSILSLGLGIVATMTKAAVVGAAIAAVTANPIVGVVASVTSTFSSSIMGIFSMFW